MIILVAASSFIFTALQASINAPTDAFRGCLKSASAKASSEKVAADGIEVFLKGQCTVQMESLKSAVVAFRTKNGMARKAALADANMTVDDYLAAPVEKYQFMIEMNKKSEPAAPAAAAAPAAPAAPK